MGRGRGMRFRQESCRPVSPDSSNLAGREPASTGALRAAIASSAIPCGVQGRQAEEVQSMRPPGMRPSAFAIDGAALDLAPAPQTVRTGLATPMPTAHIVTVFRLPSELMRVRSSHLGATVLRAQLRRPLDGEVPLCSLDLKASCELGPRLLPMRDGNCVVATYNLPRPVLGRSKNGGVSCASPKK